MTKTDLLGRRLCPTCGERLSMNGRCYKCRPGGKKSAGEQVETTNGRGAVELHAPRWSHPATAAAMAEIDAARSVAAIFDELSPDSRARVWRWLADHFLAPGELRYCPEQTVS